MNVGVPRLEKGATVHSGKVGETGNGYRNGGTGRVTRRLAYAVVLLQNSAECYRTAGLRYGTLGQQLTLLHSNQLLNIYQGHPSRRVNNYDTETSCLSGCWRRAHRYVVSVDCSLQRSSERVFSGYSQVCAVLSGTKLCSSFI